MQVGRMQAFIQSMFDFAQCITKGGGLSLQDRDEVSGLGLQKLHLYELVKDFRPSDTATLIARATILASEDKNLRALVPHDSAGTLRKILEGGAGDWVIKSLRFPLIRRILTGVERFLLPGIMTHYIIRKLQIERVVEKKIAGGCRRVVIVGAGYDTLAWRLHRKYPEVHFVELDHPATQRLKKERLESQSNLVLQSLDLNSELPSDRIQEDVSTVFVLEGVTMYFPGVRVEELMRDVISLAGERGAIVWTFMEKDGDGSFGFKNESPLISRWLGLCGEPFRWGLARDQLTGFAGSCGMAVETLVDRRQLRENYLLPIGMGDLPLAQGELLCTSIPMAL